VSKLAIKVENLVKRYHKAQVNAVDDISFEVKQGEFAAFLGPNGAGKTTTISILTTTLSKTSGNIEIAGFDLEKESSKVRQRSGIIFQNPSLDLNLTAEENIRFHAVLYGLYPFRPTFGLMPKQYQERVMELAEVIGIKNDLGKAVKSFSGGMKRKLEIIRSLMHAPEILFLDEPTTGLDPLSRRNLWQYLAQVRRDMGTTIFLTTHYLEEAEGAEHVMIINQGKIVSDGTPAQIKQDLIKEYVVLGAADITELVESLVKLGYHHTAVDNQDLLKVPVTGNGAGVQKLLAKLPVELTYLEVHTPTLEDAYLEIVESTNKSE
jgi:ABC-2 type transport system ATP-binding protein